MRTNHEWNTRYTIGDTESIDNHCKCALAINHKSGRLQWCPGCGYYKFIILIPIIMIPVVFVFILLTKFNSIYLIQDQQDSFNYDETINNELKTNSNYLINNENSISNDQQMNIDNEYSSNMIDSGSSLMYINNDDDDDIIFNYTNSSQEYNEESDMNTSEDDDINLLTNDVATKCSIVKYVGFSENVDNEERHILKDVRTSFIPSDVIFIPPKCTRETIKNNDNDDEDIKDILEINWNTYKNLNDDDKLQRFRRRTFINNRLKKIVNDNLNMNMNDNFTLQYSSTVIEKQDTFDFHLFSTNQESPENVRQAQSKIMQKYMDTTTDPCVDFYQFACGKWEIVNPIPKDKAGYDTFEMLRENLDLVLRELLTSNDDEAVNCDDNQNTNMKNEDEFDNTVKAARLRRQIITKRDKLQKLLQKYKLYKEMVKRRVRRRSIKQMQFEKLIQRYQRHIHESNDNNNNNNNNDDDDDEIDAETKAKYLYKSCMNLKLLEERGIQPLLDLLDSFGGWPVLCQDNWNSDDFDWLNLIAQLRLYNNDILIVEWVGPDIKNSDENVIQLDQTGLGLPTRDYFLHESNAKYLQAYKIFMEDVMQQLGVNKEIALETSKELIDFEIELAEITSSSDDRSNVSALYRRLTIHELQIQVPDIDWKKYLCIIQDRQINDTESVVMYAMDYMIKLCDLIKKTEKDTLANYILWRFVRHRINNLDERFKDTKQRFFHALFGREESPARWKNCIGQVNTNMGMAVGAMFVRKYFDEKSKEDTLKMTHDIQESFREILNKTDWIDSNTKHLAELKVTLMSLKIGYPDFILSHKELNKKYNGLHIDPNMYFENTLNLLRHSTKIEQSRIGEAVNKTNWQTAPAIVNAYYSRNKNQIMFPAGILQPPFYHRYFPRSLNYGGIGVVIGHELTHGFDDKGRLFDRNGNIHKWWSDSAIHGFHERAKCLISQYGNYTVSEVGISVDGESTQGENIADNGGIRQAFHAYENWLNRNKIDPKLLMQSETLPGLNMTNKQLFFLNFAQVWCGVMRPEATRNKLKTAVHSPGKFRVIGTLSNSFDFAREFNCAAGSPMNPVQKCSVW